MAKIPNPYLFTSGSSNGEWLTKSRLAKLSMKPIREIQALVRNGILIPCVDESGAKRFWSTDAFNTLIAHMKGDPPPPLEKQGC